MDWRLAASLAPIAAFCSGVKERVGLSHFRFSRRCTSPQCSMLRASSCIFHGSHWSPVLPGLRSSRASIWRSRSASKALISAAVIVLFLIGCCWKVRTEYRRWASSLTSSICVCQAIVAESHSQFKPNVKADLGTARPWLSSGRAVSSRRMVCVRNSAAVKDFGTRLLMSDVVDSVEPSSGKCPEMSQNTRESSELCAQDHFGRSELRAHARFAYIAKAHGYWRFLIYGLTNAIR
jgi:hypothetical protein